MGIHMTDWILLRVEIRWMPLLWLAVGWMDRSLVLALCGVAVKVGRK
jgi:hypothetical protein